MQPNVHHPVVARNGLRNLPVHHESMLRPDHRLEVVRGQQAFGLVPRIAAAATTTGTRAEGAALTDRRSQMGGYTVSHAATVGPFGLVAYKIRATATAAATACGHLRKRDKLHFVSTHEGQNLASSASCAGKFPLNSVVRHVDVELVGTAATRNRDLTRPDGRSKHVGCNVELEIV